jgi:hypothetical protein
LKEVAPEQLASISLNMVNSPVLARGVVGVAGPHVSSLVTLLPHDTSQDAGNLAFASGRKVGMQVFFVASVGDIYPLVSRDRMRIDSLDGRN